MKFKLNNYNRNISDEELVDDLKKVARSLNKNSVTRQEYDEGGICHSTTQIRRFGSWFNALKAAGLEESRTPPNVPEEVLFENLENVWIKLGRQPKYHEIAKPLSKYSVGTYENRFGGWRKALERFIDYVSINSNQSNNGLTVGEESGLQKHKTPRTINWRLRFLVLKRDNFKCKNCGRAPAIDPGVILHVDHIKPWSKGGETILENLQTLCSKCNIGKSNLE